MKTAYKLSKNLSTRISVMVYFVRKAPSLGMYLPLQLLKFCLNKSK